MSDADDMLLVKEIADAGSLTLAGVRLSMLRSTVSQRVALLEERPGLPRFAASVSGHPRCFG